MGSATGVWCLVVGALACAPLATAGPGCAEIGQATTLTRDLEETSGLAVGRRDPDVLWTHNDGNSDLFALSRDGEVVGRFEVGRRLTDWEDIEIAGCPAGACLYFGDTGDNAEGRPDGHVRVLRVPEPALGGDGDTRTLDPDVFPVRFPDGPRDVEALFVLGETPYLVTKGANHPVTVYRYPGPLRPDTVTLEEVQRLTDGSQPLLDRVTGASASPDERWVAIRTYQALRWYRVEEGALVPAEDGLVNLRTLREIQGEGVGVGPEGLTALTSEGGPLGGPPSLRLMRCRLEVR